MRGWLCKLIYLLNDSCTTHTSDLLVDLQTSAFSLHISHSSIFISSVTDTHPSNEERSSAVLAIISEYITAAFNVVVDDEQEER